jgi:DNA-binding transcriptional ArsR family regulator
MKDKFQIAKHANLVDEAIFILYLWVNKDELEQTREEYRDNYSETSEWYEGVWDTIFEIYNAVKQELSPKKDLIEYYFKSKNLNFFFNATFAFLWDFQNYDNQLLSYEERVANLKEEDRIKFYAQIINIEEEAGAPIEGLVTYDDFISFLDTASCDKAEKWEALKIFHTQKESYNEISAILKEVVDFITTRYQKQIEKLEQQFYLYWDEIQEKQDILELLHNNLKLVFKANDNGTVLLPVIFQPISVSLSCNPETDMEDVLRFGILMDSRLNISRESMEAEDIVNFGKLLCDKSKVDILELTAKKPCYGKEIANELKLSTPTISYHVNALIKMGLLKTVLDSNRVYYSLNSERFSQYLDGIKRYFQKNN